MVTTRQEKRYLKQLLFLKVEYLKALKMVQLRIRFTILCTKLTRQKNPYFH